MGSVRSLQKKALGLSSTSPHPVREPDVLDSGSGYCGNWASKCRPDMGSLKHWHHLYHWRFSCEETVRGKKHGTILRPNKKIGGASGKSTEVPLQFRNAGTASRTSVNKGIGACHQLWLRNLCDRVWHDCCLNIIIMWSYPIQRIENHHRPRPRKALRAGTRWLSCCRR